VSSFNAFRIRLIRKYKNEQPLSKELTRNNRWVDNNTGDKFDETEALRIEQQLLRNLKERWNHRHYYAKRTGKKPYPMSAYTLVIFKDNAPKSHEPSLTDLQRNW